MPRKKDFLSVKENGERKHIQKRLLLSNLKEVYQLFSEKYPNIRNIQKNVSLQEQVVLTVCVCTIHQNVKLMIIRSHMNDLQLEDELETPTNMI